MERKMIDEIGEAIKRKDEVKLIQLCDDAETRREVFRRLIEWRNKEDERRDRRNARRREIRKEKRK